VGIYSDMKYWDVFRDPKWILDNLFRRYKVVIVPTAGWGTSNVGSGGVVVNPFRLNVYTGTTASSRGMAVAPVSGLNSGDIRHDYVDWTKRLELHFAVVRVNSDPECIARVQLKESSVEGALAQRGIGLEIQNYTMYGEGYGTSRGTVSLLTLTDNRLAKVRIVKAGSRLEFYVNDVLRGVLTGDSVPNVKGDAISNMVVSIINGATGGVNANLIIMDMKVIQER
jgi:hypothetical protein